MIVLREINQGKRKGEVGYSNSGYADCLNSIENSWTFISLNKEEKDAVANILLAAQPKLTEDSNYGDDWDLASSMYRYCLTLLGYKEGNFKRIKNQEIKDKLVRQANELISLANSLED